MAGAAACLSDPFLARLGPEPLGDVFTLTALRHALRRHGRAAIKAVLLDQSVVAGIGNLYADETLYRARIHPARRAALLPVRRRAGAHRDRRTRQRVLPHLSVGAGARTTVRAPRVTRKGQPTGLPGSQD